MPLQKCGRCKNIFFKTNSEVCPLCVNDEAADYTKIREALEKFPQLDASGLAEAAEVSVACVLRMLRDGYIESVESDAIVTCGRCGAPALSPSKRLCVQCLGKLDQQCAEALRALKMAANGKATPISTNDVRDAVDRKRGLVPDEALGKLSSPPAPGQGMAIRDRLQGKRR